MTPLAAATATPALAPWVGLAALIWVLGYVIACVIWPWTACPSCKGAGRHRSPSGKAWRDCRRCAGRGRRLRLGRRLWRAATSTRDRS